jgi:TrmH family RNA methyltransferase
MTTPVSRNNPKIKQIRQLLAHRKDRESTKLFVVEGIHHIGEAFEAQAQVEYLCYAPDLLESEFARRLIQEQERSGTVCVAVDSDTFSSLAGKENPQGIIAVVQQAPCLLSDLSPATFPWAVALVAPQDPGNIGTILRTINAVGASGLLLLDDPTNGQYCADPYHPSAVRASMGTIFWHPLARATFSDFVQWARRYPYKIYGTSAHASLDYRISEQYQPPLILMMGSEREGLSTNQSAVCDVMLKMPMRGRVSSLNLAVATGVMLYSILDKLETAG